MDTEIVSIEVREVASEEYVIVRSIFEKVFAETFSSNIPKFEEVTKGEKIFVAVSQETIVGMASVWEPNQFIHFLFVISEYRNLKVGRTLVSRLAETYGTLTLKCLISNQNGMKFYLATGWEQVGTGVSEEGGFNLLRYSLSSNNTLE